MERLFGAAPHPSGANEPGVDRVPELRHHDEVIDQNGLGFRQLSPEQIQFSDPRSAFLNLLYEPQALIALLGRSPLWQHSHLVAFADRPLRQFNRLGAVPLEVQAECQSRRQCLELSFQIGPLLGVFGPYLGNQIGKSRHFLFPKKYLFFFSDYDNILDDPIADTIFRHTHDRRNEYAAALCRQARIAAEQRLQ
jgi:hypothetical protein